MAEGADGYRVVFSLAELDSGIADSEVLVADTMDGAPLGDKQGPLRFAKRLDRLVRLIRPGTKIRQAYRQPLTNLN